MAWSLVFAVLTSPDIGACVLAFLDAVALAAVASVSTFLSALVDGAAAVWGDLLLAERPHLVPLLSPLPTDGNAAKALYRERMLLDGEGQPSAPSDESERARLERGLASVFMRVELRDTTTDRVLGSCVVPLWEAAKMSALFGGGVEIVVHGEKELSLDYVWKECELALEVVDLGGKGFQRKLTADCAESDWLDEDSLWLFFPGLSYIGPPQPFFAEVERISIHFHAHAGVDETERVTRMRVRLSAWHNATGNEVVGEVAMGRLQEMLLDGRITIK